MLEDPNYCQQVQFYSNTVEQDHVDGHHVYHVDYKKQNVDYPHHYEFGVSVKHYFDKDDWDQMIVYTLTFIISQQKSEKIGRGSFAPGK